MSAPIPDYSKVSLLLPMSGANNGTVFTDLSHTPKTITRSGGVITTTAQSKFYGSSAYFDGTADSLSVPTSAAFQYGTGDFRINLWVRPSTTQIETFPRILAVGSLSTGMGSWALLYGAAATSFVFTIYRPTAFDVAAFAVTPDNWHYVEIGRSSGTAVMSVNGVISGTASDSTSLSLSQNMIIGAETTAGSQDFTGHIQDLCVHKGVPARTSDFTPPTRLIGSIGTSAADPILDDAGSPAIRSIVAFPRTYPSKLVTTASASDGSFSLTQLPATDYSVVYLDDDAGTLHNDLVQRVIPA